MKVLVLGGSGMLGHKLVQQLSVSGHDVWATFRGDSDRFARFGIFDPQRCFSGVDALDPGSFNCLIEDLRPDVIVNAVGVIKQKDAIADAASTIEVNSVFPHRLQKACENAGARLITFSTDCVFSGGRGDYTEKDIPDAADLYGRSKALGEVLADNAVTLRTSMIGRELASKKSLLEWFLKHRGGTVRGFTNAVFTGFPTVTLARLIGELILPNTDLSGLYHISGPKISKYGLLGLIRKKMRLNVEITPVDEPRIDRSLDSTRFRAATGFAPNGWEQMIDQMLEDPTKYDEW